MTTAFEIRIIAIEYARYVIAETFQKSFTICLNLNSSKINVANRFLYSIFTIQIC